MSKKFFIIFYTILQLTWGVIQSAAGFILFLLLIRHKHNYYHGAIVTYWNSLYSVSMGIFIFQCNQTVAPNDNTIVHEYGHTIQSIILGPLYLLVIGLPSATWALSPYFVKYRAKHNVSYYKLYCETWANSIGAATVKKLVG